MEQEGIENQATQNVAPEEDENWRPFLFFRRWTLNRKAPKDEVIKPTMMTGSASELETAMIEEEMATGAAIMVDFPFEVDLEHDPIDIATMFKATLAFDEHEVNPEKFGTGAATDLIVDVVAVGRTESTLRITPNRGLGYGKMAAEVQELIERVSKNTFNGKLYAKQLRWYLREYGVSSDQRRNYHRIQ